MQYEQCWLVIKSDALEVVKPPQPLILSLHTRFITDIKVLCHEERSCSLKRGCYIVYGSKMNGSWHYHWLEFEDVILCKNLEFITIENWFWVVQPKRTMISLVEWIFDHCVVEDMNTAYNLMGFDVGYRWNQTE